MDILNDMGVSKLSANSKDILHLTPHNPISNNTCSSINR